MNEIVAPNISRILPFHGSSNHDKICAADLLKASFKKLDLQVIMKYLTTPCEEKIYLSKRDIWKYPFISHQAFIFPSS